MMRELMDARADVDVKDSFGCTPLHVCVESAVESELGPSVGICVHGSALGKFRYKFGAIVGRGMDRNSDDSDQDLEPSDYCVVVEDGPPDGMSLDTVHISTIFDVATDLLIEARADVNIGNHRVGVGHSVLHEAARSGLLTLAQKVIAAAADVNTQRVGSGLTPLHLAVRGRKVELVELLLKHRADANLVASGKTAIQLAAVNGLQLDLATCSAIDCKQKGHRSPTELERATLFLE